MMAVWGWAQWAFVATLLLGPQLAVGLQIGISRKEGKQEARSMHR